MSKIKALIVTLFLGTSSVAMAAPSSSYTVSAHASASFGVGVRTSGAGQVVIRDHRTNVRYDDRFDHRYDDRYDDRVGAMRINVTGTYDSNYGPVTLVQRGNRVTGTFTTPGGGTINGIITHDGILQFTWSDPSGFGKGVWYLNGRGRMINGTFGNKNAFNERAWNLTKTR